LIKRKSLRRVTSLLSRARTGFGDLCNTKTGMKDSRVSIFFFFSLLRSSGEGTVLVEREDCRVDGLCDIPFEYSDAYMDPYTW
jgi:hypothetical protein